MKITEPGLYPDLKDEDYRAQHEWLSVSGAKKLLPPYTPAHYKASLGTEEHKPQFDMGKAFHREVLGDGPDIHVYEGDSWRSADAKAFRANAYAQGHVPLLADEYATVKEMAAAVAAHDVAPLLFQGGKAEVSAFWIDPATGVQCKARFDYLPEKQEGRRLIVPDLKSAISGDPTEFSRASARYGYVLQQDWYSDAVRVLGIDDDPLFLFVVAEKDSPYVVSVNQFADDDEVAICRAANDRARRIYRECIETDTWPGRPGVTQLSLPPWHLTALEESVA